MGMTIAQKILKAHLVDGEMVLGQEIGLKIDQTLTQDATGTMAYLQFEAMGVPIRSRPSARSLTLTTTPCSPASKMRTTTNISVRVAKKHGIYYSQAGQRHLPSGASGALRRHRARP